MRLGQTITELRKESNMTQEEFAQIFHVTRQTVSNWEKEKNYPDFDLQFHAAFLDYYTQAGEKAIEIRWSGMGEDAELKHEIHYLDEYGQLKKTLSKEEESDLCGKNPEISAALIEGDEIYNSVYE